MGLFFISLLNNHLFCEFTSLVKGLFKYLPRPFLVNKFRELFT